MVQLVQIQLDWSFQDNNIIKRQGIYIILDGGKDSNLISNMYLVSKHIVGDFRNFANEYDWVKFINQSKT